MEAMNMSATRPLAVIALALEAAVMTVAPSAAQSVGDAASGQRLAEVWCVQCHRIGSQNADASRSPPDFGAVANMRSFSELSMRVFLQTPHGQMPRYEFSPVELDDLIAYLASLRRS
jgi:mono/diheme cytochrome c family protein